MAGLNGNGNGNGHGHHNGNGHAPPDSNWTPVQLHRRRLVAQLLLRGLSGREIERSLDKDGERNPETREPWVHRTIAEDIKALERLWKVEALRDLETLKGRALAEIRELRRVAWAKQDYRLVRMLIGDERELLALDMPLRLGELVDAVADSMGLEGQEYEELYQRGLDVFRENGWPVN